MSASILSRNVIDLTAVDYSELRLPMFVIYEHPADFPEHIVVRLWDMDRPTNIIHLANNIAEAEAAIPYWFAKTFPQSVDDPKIKAVFI